MEGIAKRARPLSPAGGLPTPKASTGIRLVRMLSMAKRHRHDPFLPVVGDADALQIIFDRVVILTNHDLTAVLGWSVKELCLQVPVAE